MIELKTEVFTVDGVEIEVREPIGMDGIDVRSVYNKLAYDRKDDLTVNRAVAFADFVVRTTRADGLDWWVGVRATAEDMQAAFEQWQQLPAKLISRWEIALMRTNAGNF